MPFPKFKIGSRKKDKPKLEVSQDNNGKATEKLVESVSTSQLPNDASFPKPSPFSSNDNGKSEREMQPKSLQSHKAGQAVQKQDTSWSLLQEAWCRSLTDGKVREAYMEIGEALKEQQPFADPSSSPPIQQVLEHCKSKADSSMKKDILDNFAKGLSSSVKILSPAASVEPHVGLVCTVLSIVALPLLNIVEQQDALLEGLNKISMIIIRSNSVGDELAQKPGDTKEIRQTQEELKSRIIELYSIITTFQILAARHLHRSRRIRATRDAFQTDNWKTFLDDIAQCEANCWELINKINADRSKSRSDRKDRLEQVQYLDRLPVVQAAFNDKAQSNKTVCLEGTRVGLREEIVSWSTNPQSKFIFWLSGPAGTGKSTIAMTVAQQFSNERRLGGSFFFTRQQDAGDTENFFTTLAAHLASLSPEFSHLITEAIANHDRVDQKKLSEQWKWLLSEPLKTCRTYWSPIIFVIDALDECSDKSALHDILSLLAELEHSDHVPLRIFITSRPDVRGLDDMCSSIHQVNLENVDHCKEDVSYFIKCKLDDIRERRCRSRQKWPDDDQVQHLQRKADGLFIYAATVCRFVDVHLRYNERLQKVLQTDSHGTDELRATYTQILQDAADPSLTEEERKEVYADINDILVTITVLLKPLPAAALGALIWPNDAMPDKIDDYLDRLRSILDVPPDRNLPIRTYHLSFREFFLGAKHVDTEFGASETEAHHLLLNRCLEVLSRNLKMNICGLSDPCSLASDVGQKQVTEHLPDHVQYACRFWVYHLLQGDIFQHHDTILSFLKHHLLHWLEAMSLIEQMNEAALMVTALCDTLLPRDSSELFRLVKDTRLFLASYRSVIATAPLQLYHSTFIFCPTNSLVRELWTRSEDFSTSLPSQATLAPECKNWDASAEAYRHVLHGHTDMVQTLAFSNNGLLASGSDDNTVRVWDTKTGKCTHELRGHTSKVTIVTFSPKALLASGSEDKTVRVWDPRTGECKHNLQGHTDVVQTLAFSHKGLLASGSGDFTVRVWDTETGECRNELQGHDASIQAVAFSSEGLLASGSADLTVRVWDPETGKCMHELHDYFPGRPALVFPSDSLLAYGCINYTVKVWNLKTGECTHELQGHNDGVSTLAVSQDGLLASGARESIVRVWDPRTGECMHELCGHKSWIETLAFSQNGQLASGSYDGTIRVWDPRTGECTNELQGHAGVVLALAFSPDSLLVSTASETTIRVWDPKIADHKHEYQGHTDWVWALAFSRGGLLASGSDDATVRVWDLKRGECKYELQGHIKSIKILAFSPDGLLLASGSGDNIVKVWDPNTRECRYELQGHGGSNGTLAFSQDSLLLATGSDDGTVRVWDSRTGECKHVLQGHTGLVSELVFSQDGLLASGSVGDDDVRVWDLNTGECKHVLRGHTRGVATLAFSSDGLLAAGSFGKTVMIWASKTGQCIQQLHGHTSTVRTLVFSQSGLLAAGDYKRTVRVWNPKTAECERVFDDLDICGHESEFPESLWSSSNPPFYSLDKSNRWVMQNGRRFLLLPDSYYDYATHLVRENILALGFASGRVAFLQLRDIL